MTQQHDLVVDAEPVDAELLDSELLDALTEAECRHLLRSRTFGRVGVTSGGLPVILPVRYYYEGDAITFRTGEGTKLRAAQSGDVLAFQVDAYDSETCEGWSVLVLGRASVLTTEHENHYVRMGCELVTGRVLTRVPPD
jgi:nitroimidazol reductase NimA-like FMN-containing flavoprotein (pyridoxamine 5'-phosphate oxidase superfamily)